MKPSFNPVLTKARFTEHAGPSAARRRGLMSRMAYHRHGSADRTVEVARQHGVDHIVSHTANKGLAVAFQTGLNACLSRGADIIVNTDADNQYPGEYIPALIRPILQHKADMVVADRQVDTIPHFSPVKKQLQKLGSWVIRVVSGTSVPDAPSGFRALSRETALRINVVTAYTYTLDTIIQVGKRNLTVTSIPIEVNDKTRESRLIAVFPICARSIFTILKSLFSTNRCASSLLSLPFFYLAEVSGSATHHLDSRRIRAQLALQSLIVGSGA